MHSNEYEKCMKTSGKTNNSDINSSDTSKQASKDTSEPKQITFSAVFKRAAPLPSNSPGYSSAQKIVPIPFACNAKITAQTFVKCNTHVS